jgi:hypothetical protein
MNHHFQLGFYIFKLTGKVKLSYVIQIENKVKTCGTIHKGHKSIDGGKMNRETREGHGRQFLKGILQDREVKELRKPFLRGGNND